MSQHSSSTYSTSSDANFHRSGAYVEHHWKWIKIYEISGTSECDAIVDTFKTLSLGGTGYRQSSSAKEQSLVAPVDLAAAFDTLEISSTCDSGKKVNTTSPILRLPSELLRYIFRIVAELRPSSNGEPLPIIPAFQIAGVCHAWRSVSLELSSLWETIDLSQHTAPSRLRAELAFSRSQVRPLYVRIGYESLGLAVTLLKKFNASSRVHVLDLYSTKTWNPSTNGNLESGPLEELFQSVVNVRSLLLASAFLSIFSRDSSVSPFIELQFLNDVQTYSPTVAHQSVADIFRPPIPVLPLRRYNLLRRLQLPCGARVILRNNAKSPFPIGLVDLYNFLPADGQPIKTIHAIELIGIDTLERPALFYQDSIDTFIMWTPNISDLTLISCDEDNQNDGSALRPQGPVLNLLLRQLYQKDAARLQRLETGSADLPDWKYWPSLSRLTIHKSGISLEWLRQFLETRARLGYPLEICRLSFDTTRSWSNAEIDALRKEVRIEQFISHET
jgi:hypothetical protein